MRMVEHNSIEQNSHYGGSSHGAFLHTFLVVDKVEEHQFLFLTENKKAQVRERMIIWIRTKNFHEVILKNVLRKHFISLIFFKAF